jgi:ABC-type lipoprotein export system ATPase subunit
MIVCENLVKIYKVADLEVFALQGLDLRVEKGEMIAIIGNSGSGKSTLMNMIGGLDRPSAGKLMVDGKDLLKLDDKELFRYKRETVGFVWQSNSRNLISYLTALENVELPMLLSGKRRRNKARELLEQVGLGDRLHSRLDQLSGGEQQRVAIAIALANDPKILLADEPTGSVDTTTASQIMDLFRKLNQEMGLTIVIVTHDPRIARKVDRVVAIRDGKTSSELIRRKSYSEALQELEAAGLTADDEGEDTHEELAIVDSAGRLQSPQEYLEALDMTGKDKIKVELEDGRIVLTPPKM